MQQESEEGSEPAQHGQSFAISSLVKDALILHTNVQRRDYISEEEFIADSDVVERAAAIADILESHGVKTDIKPWSEKIPLQLYQEKPSVVINLVETVKGNTMAASAIPALFQLMGINYTGATNQVFLQTSNKAQVKDTLFEYDLPTPQYELVTDITDKIPKSSVEFPMIIKPNTHVGGSVGIDDTSVCNTWKHVYSKVNRLLDEYDTPVLVEEFIEGRELTAVVIQDEHELSVYFGEKVFKQKPDKRSFSFLSWNAVWNEEDAFEYAPYVDKSGYLTTICKEAFEVFELSGYVKFDIRLNKQNRPYIIDVNANSSLGPNDEAIANVPRLYGVPFEQTLYKIIKSSLKREVA